VTVKVATWLLQLASETVTFAMDSFGRADDQYCCENERGNNEFS